MNLLTYREENAGQIVKDERELAGLTVKMLSLLSGVSERTIYYIERGEKKLTYKTGKKLCMVLSDDYKQSYNVKWEV